MPLQPLQLKIYSFQSLRVLRMNVLYAPFLVIIFIKGETLSHAIRYNRLHIK